MQMRVLSAPKVERYSPAAGEVLISIRTPGSQRPTLRSGWQAVLHVEFADTGPFAPLHDAGEGLSEEIAAEILDFVATHRLCRRLVVQCHAGVSRSRSLAAVIAELYGLPYRWTALNADVVRITRHVAALRAARRVD